MTNDDARTKKSLEVEVEVPGTPEQVWDAIATSTGVAAWFYPFDVEGREGGAVSMDMGSGLEQTGVVAEWDPPRRYVYEEDQPFGDPPGGTLATEWLVEARSGGTCIVRVVSSVFASGDDWDDQLGDMRDGWRIYLHNLRLRLTHFRGQPCSPVIVIGNLAAAADPAWAALRAALGLPDAGEGEAVKASATDVPALSGVVERRADAPHHAGLILRLDQPAPGNALVFAYSDGANANLGFHLYLFGDEAAEAAAREGPKWQAWMKKHFQVAEANASTA